MYYNQNNYPNIPYPAPGYEKATVKSGGCGPCSASMVVEGLTGVSFPPEQSAPFAIKCGARVSGGTNMRTLAEAVSAEFGLVFSSTSSENELAAHIAAGGWAIANVGGDRAGYVGLFSDGGHYIVVRGAAGDGRLIVWDSANYSGKYTKTGRKGRVEVKGNDIYVSLDELGRDTATRSPAYHLFSAIKKEEPKVDDTPSSWAQEAWQKAIDAGVTDGTNPKGPTTREQLIVILDRLGLIK